MPGKRGRHTGQWCIGDGARKLSKSHNPFTLFSIWLKSVSAPHRQPFMGAAGTHFRWGAIWLKDPVAAVRQCGSVGCPVIGAQRPGTGVRPCARGLVGHPGVDLRSTVQSGSADSFGETVEAGYWRMLLRVRSPLGFATLVSARPVTLLERRALGPLGMHTSGLAKFTRSGQAYAGQASGPACVRLVVALSFV